MTESRDDIPRIEELQPVPLPDLIAGLSRALDLTEGEPLGHAVRTCWIGMRVGQRLGLPETVLHDLYYALLLKDAGCSANAAQVSSWFGTDDLRAKPAMKTIKWTAMTEAARFALQQAAPGQPLLTRVRHVMALARRGFRGARELVELRCTRGAQVVRELGWTGIVPEAVLHLDEHWDGSGFPRGARGEEIPLLARILLLAQTVAIFARRYGLEAARDVVRDRRGSWFDPAVADAYLAVAADPRYAGDIGSLGESAEMADWVLPSVVRAGQGTPAADLSKIARVFGQIVDAKSPWTARHSARTARYAGLLADRLGYPAGAVQFVRVAAFFHDLGKLGVSNVLLDKPGRLAASERAQVERHAALTATVLEPLVALKPLAEIAAAHHERLDGSGYHRHLVGRDVPAAAQIVAVADVFDALRADRPYRPALSIEQALDMLADEVAAGRLAAPVVEALRSLSFDDEPRDDRSDWQGNFSAG
jgi:putative nucleotidyltransferase with HDIG domain